MKTKGEYKKHAHQIPTPSMEIELMEDRNEYPPYVLHPLPQYSSF